MECYGRRNRRGRGRSHQNQPSFRDYIPPQEAKPWSFLSGLYSLVVMASLIAVIYMMLEYHCETCKTQYNIDEITKNIDVIAKNLSDIVHNYYDLETKISKLSSDLPKVEGQMEVLEALAHSLDTKTLETIKLPKVDILITQPIKQETNNSIKSTGYLQRPIEVGTD
ncbi:uncharacterized protein LOC128673585 [Plodia interpunctella]|uniref:uncharacterized protein LOC128673585 n=1 Tax=Plodia interpunctella TaxID=58824 RepID=UPI002367E337|nr:uncharacterized protein LOC128673585 [Plodia interpunctella]